MIVLAVNNDLTRTTQYISDASMDFIYDTDMSIKEAFNETTMWAQNKLFDMAETISLPHNLMQSLQQSDEEKTLAEIRFEKYGDPCENIRLEEDEFESYFLN